MNTDDTLLLPTTSNDNSTSVTVLVGIGTGARQRNLQNGRYESNQDAPERGKHPGVSILAYFASWRETVHITGVLAG